VKAPSQHAWRHKAFVGYVMFMLLLFLLPLPGTPENTTKYLDKAAHFGVFMGFAVLFHLGRPSRPASALLASVAFAAIIEVLQGLLPYRDGDWADLAAGAAGGTIGAALMLWRARQSGAAT
jgi:VanZ family protein